MFLQIYDLERRIKQDGLIGDAVVAIRQQAAVVPILQKMKTWMQEKYPKVIARKNATAQAMVYCLSRSGKLSVYTTDERLNTDNNPLEDAIGPVVEGTKNSLFARSHEAAGRSAMDYSLMATFKLHNIY